MKQSFYCYRPVLHWSAELIAKWAEEHGFSGVMDPSDMHVTIAYTKGLVDWEEKFQPDARQYYNEYGIRSLARLGDQGAVVLKLESDELTTRWQYFVDNGCSWDYPEYQPHVTFAYGDTKTDLDIITPYEDMIWFDGEVFEPLDENWASKIKTKNE